MRAGLLTPDKTIIDATSGNTGIAYAMIGAALGYHVQLYLPQNTSPERKKIIRQYGATIVETDPLEGSDGAYLEVQAQVAAHPERYFYPDQYNNPVNPQTHFATTGKEILGAKRKASHPFCRRDGHVRQFCRHRPAAEV